MKRYVCLIICFMVVVLFISCKSDIKNESKHVTTTPTIDDKETIIISDGLIKYDVSGVELIDYDSYYSDGSGIVLQTDAIPNEEIAVKVARDIYNGIRSEAEEEYVPQNVAYDEEKAVWVVEFYPEQDYSSGFATLTDSFFIALQKSDGKVLKMWYC